MSSSGTVEAMAQTSEIANDFAGFDACS
jgi:hypothetical protein